MTAAMLKEWMPRGRYLPLTSYMRHVGLDKAGSGCFLYEVLGVSMWRFSCPRQALLCSRIRDSASNTGGGRSLRAREGR